MAKRGRPPHPDILTPREWQVLALLREGLSNEQIAEWLGITVRTARYHVSEILSKLGVATRQEAAAWRPEERRLWWATVLAPVALVWRKVGFAWFSPAILAIAGVAVAAGVGLLVWGLLRTQTDGGANEPDDTAVSVPTALVSPTTTPEPPDELVWESEDGRVIVSGLPRPCGDAATAQAYGMPMTLEIAVSRMFVIPTLLGLEAEPYEYVPAQVVDFGGDWVRAPEGWELTQRNVLNWRAHPNRMTIGREIFLRRLDQPSLLFRYSADLCNPDGSPAEPPEREPGLTLELPQDLPQIVMHRQGDYISAQEAIDIAMGNGPAGVWPVAGALGTSEDIYTERGLQGLTPLSMDPEQVVWVVVLALGDHWGPKRPGHEHGSYTIIDASTGSREGLGWGCCLDLVMSP